MKKTKRALTRHHQQRVENNRKNYWGRYAKSSEKALSKCSRSPACVRAGCVVTKENTMAQASLKNIRKQSRL